MPYENGPWEGWLEPGRKLFCACGESENKPFCDASHARKRTGRKPHVVEITEAGRYTICQCGTTRNAPFCDDSHLSLPGGDEAEPELRS